MVDGLFFCATLTDRRGGHTSFVQAGVETFVSLPVASSTEAQAFVETCLQQFHQHQATSPSALLPETSPERLR